MIIANSYMKGLAMNRWIILGTIILLSGGAWWLWQENPQLHSDVMAYLQNGEILTLESKYTPDYIMEQKRSVLLQDNTRTYQEPSLSYYPYLLMDVKFTQNDKRPKEAQVLWSLVDGEIVINTDTWEKTHGFADAMLAKANKDDFKILNILGKNRGTTTIEQIVKELHLDSAVVEPWIQSTIDKHLVVRNGNQVHLYFENPKLAVYPQTKFTKNLVKKPYNQLIKVSQKFTRSEIEKIAKAAFGNDFTIRSVKEVFLPVFNIKILNGDGSIHTSDWNSINGQRMDQELISKL